MLEAQPKGAFLLFGNGDVGKVPAWCITRATTSTMQVWSGMQLLGRTGRSLAAINKTTPTTLFGKEHGMTAIVNGSVI